ncbi:OLC1v1035186C1 [Oldenlandia corymbosa var. corymbosa]|uniref:OLC1v1035186C1 n=1 Tax=Oldenlandia corymbosa var. corymbosa TaxID=529605 RepID=A0AAV1CT32_OLDCO|nr:OLC1v1035186C1 [Oldenlandia corymbosa var. corymbosa]
MAKDSSNKNWSLLGRLRGAVKKIRVLLNFDLNRFKLASLISGASFKRQQKRLSFNDRPGLTAFVDGGQDSDSNGSGGSAGRALQRTISCPSDQEDIDKRAEMFIANFYKQLKMERQISLQLRYTRGYSFDSPSP